MVFVRNGWIVVALLTFFSDLAFADPEESSLRTDIVQSGRDKDVIEINRQAIKKVDDVLDLLGIDRPPHRMEFVPSGQLPHLAVLGRPAVGHWYDGSIIATQARGAMGVMEFVTPGCPTCRSFYSDSTTPEQQIEIFKHVGGHNDFSVNSTYCKIRQPCDLFSAAHLLYDFMENAYRTYDFDEVAQWYQYLMSLSSAQDYARGTFSHPDTFKRDPLQHGPFHPKVKTPHELQFLVHNLPSELPKWKSEMAILFEQMNRMAAYMVQTKIMNEGWATFVQELMVPYLPWTDDHNLIESAELRSGVAVPDLKNPYWLGRAGWRNLYKRFNKRDELLSLSQLERDREFVKYAHRLMEQSGDYDFLRIALDADWAAFHHLFLYRTASSDEQDESLPSPTQPNQEQKIVISVEARDIADYIAKHLADRALQIPRIWVENRSATGKNVFSLAHEIIDDIPLKRDSAAQAIYIRTQIWHRPVSLKTVGASTWLPKKKGAESKQGSPWSRRVFGKLENEKIEVFPIRIEIDPSGKVEVFKLEGTGASATEVLNDDLTSRYQSYVDSFKEELAGTAHEALEGAQKKRFDAIAATLADGAVEASMDLVSHSASSSTAILRYYEMIERRLYAAMKRAMNGKTAMKRTQKGARIRVLPQIPEFEFDERIKRELAKNDFLKLKGNHSQLGWPLDLMELLRRSPASKTQYSYSLAIDIGGGSSTPKDGDRFWGDQKDDPDEGEDEDGEGEPKEKGQESGREKGADPTEIDVPLELIGEFLKEDIELPNLRPKSGPSLIVDPEKDGAHHRQQGEILWNRVAPRILELGMIAQKKKGLDPRKVRPKQIFQEGLKYLQPSDWIVPAFHLKPRPDMKAVIVIWMDMTGSMVGKPITMAKQFMFNFKALLSTKYKQITFRYVGFSDQAIEFPTEEKFFRGFLNGGTNYATGIEKTREILKEYESASWDKFSFGIGDVEDGNSSQSVAVLKDLILETEYSAFIQTDTGFNSPDGALLRAIEELASEATNYFGFGILKPSTESGIEVIRQLLGKGQK